MTIYHRRQEYNMLGERRDTLTDIELRSLLRDWRREMPEIGQSMVIGRLHLMSFHVQRERVRVAIRAVDPPNTALCMCSQSVDKTATLLCTWAKLTLAYW